VLVFRIHASAPTYPVLVGVTHPHLRSRPQRRHLPLKLCRKPTVIRIQQRHPARCRVLDTHISRGRDAAILLSNYGDSRDVCRVSTGQPLTGAISRSVIDNDDFVRSMGLSENRIQRTGQSVLSVVRRDDDSDAFAGNLISRACAYFETSSAMIAMQSPALTRPPWRIA